MKISVTQQHINNGVRVDHCRCPLALAILEQAGPPVVVNYLDIRIRGVTYRTTKEMRDFVSAFDQGASVSPMEFEL